MHLLYMWVFLWSKQESLLFWMHNTSLSHAATLTLHVRMYACCETTGVVTYETQSDTRRLMASWRPAVVIFNPLGYVSLWCCSPTLSAGERSLPLNTHRYGCTCSDIHQRQSRCPKGDGNSSMPRIKYVCGQSETLRLSVNVNSYLCCPCYDYLFFLDYMCYNILHSHIDSVNRTNSLKWDGIETRQRRCLKLTETIFKSSCSATVTVGLNDLGHTLDKQ